MQIFIGTTISNNFSLLYAGFPLRNIKCNVHVADMIDQFKLFGLFCREDPPVGDHFLLFGCDFLSSFGDDFQELSLHLKNHFLKKIAIFRHHLAKRRAHILTRA